MATKEKSVWFCTNCGNEYSKWLGQCPACKEWNTLVEKTVATGKAPKAAAAASRWNATGTPTTTKKTRLKTPPGSGNSKESAGLSCGSAAAGSSATLKPRCNPCGSGWRNWTGKNPHLTDCNYRTVS